MIRNPLNSFKQETNKICGYSRWTKFKRGQNGFGQANNEGIAVICIRKRRLEIWTLAVVLEMETQGRISEEEKKKNKKTMESRPGPGALLTLLFSLIPVT